MALLDALGAKLVTDGVGTLATDIFLSYLPDSPDVAVAVYEDRGNGADQVFGASVVSIERPSIRVVARASRDEGVELFNDRAICKFDFELKP